MSETFGQFLTRRRKAAGLKQAELARRIGFTPRYLSYLERDIDPTGISKTPRPSPRLADAIAKALDIPAAEVRCAAGLGTPSRGGSCEETRNGFEESDFAALYHKHQTLDAEQRRNFRPVLEMIDRELDRLRELSGGSKPA